MNRTRMTSRRMATALLIPGLGLAACGNSNSTPGPGVYMDGGPDAKHDGTTKGGKQGKLPGSDSSTDSNQPEACATASGMATPPAPLEMVLLMDRSGSMAYNNSWNYELESLKQFFYNSNSVDIGVGLLYSPIIVGDDRASCDPAAYANPAVPVAPLSSNVGALLSSLAGTQPFGGSPITIGFEGAVAYAKERQKAEPTHKVVIVYATDAVGINSCAVVPDGGLTNTLENAEAVLSQAAAADPPIQTFVIGVSPPTNCDGLSDAAAQACTGATGMPLHNAAQTFAQAGGTGSAFLVGATADGGDPVDFEAKFIAALQSIQKAVSLPCDYGIPPSKGGAIDFADVNVSFTSSSTDGAATVGFYGVTTPNDCSSAACNPDDPKGVNCWYYVNGDGGMPDKIEFCPATCKTVTAATTGKVNIEFGCTPTLPPPDLLK